MDTDVSPSPRTARAIEILADLVRFDTTSSNSNLALLDYIRDLLARHSVSAELIPSPTGEKANLFATIGPPRAGGVILSGHTDVVPVADQQWTSDPFRLTHRDDRLYGRGTADMKAFVACSLAALDFIAPNELHRPVHLAFSYDEEVGCLGAPRMIERIHSSIALPALAIVGEPSRMRIIASHKGVHIYEVGVRGVPAHSSTAHLGLSANAVAIRLMHVLLQIAARLTGDDLRNPKFDPPFSTLTIGLMKGGTAANILAAEASFVFDLRCLPDQDPDEVLAPFHAEIEAIRTHEPAARISLKPLAAVPPLAQVAESKAEAFVRHISGDNSDILVASFGAEAGQFQQAGFSTVICGPGSIDQAHQPDEFIEIGEIDKCMLLMDRLFKATGLEGVIAIHSTALGPAAGGCRMATYISESAAVADALRLSRGMTYKNALAELPAGGGKAVLFRVDPHAPRRAIFEAFGRAVEDLQGQYITAEDVGTSVADMQAVAHRTRYVAGLPNQSGRAGGDPSPWTALGVFVALEAAADRPLKGARVAVQGLGSVGFKLCERLHAAGARLVVADVDGERTSAAQYAFGADIEAVDRIWQVEADVFSPNALGAVLNVDSIPDIKARVICGGANNQLASPEDGQRLFDRGIVYAPDYLVNAGGIINVMAEYLGEPESAVEARVRKIGERTRAVLAEARSLACPPHRVADRMAQERIGHLPALSQA